MSVRLPLSTVVRPIITALPSPLSDWLGMPIIDPATVAVGQLVF